MKTPFLQVETHGTVSQAARDQLTSHYQQQQNLLGTLGAIWDHNAAILKRHGYLTPSDWTGTPMNQNILEADAVEAYRIIQACCDLWKDIWSGDPFAIANAGFWLGRMTCGDTFRQFNRRNAQILRSDAKAQARAVFLSRPAWDKPAQFVQAIRKAKIDFGQPATCRKWLREFQQ